MCRRGHYFGIDEPKTLRGYSPGLLDVRRSFWAFPIRSPSPSPRVLDKKGRHPTREDNGGELSATGLFRQTLMPCDSSVPLLWCDHHSVQIYISSSLLSKNIKSKKYRTTDASFLLCGHETWSLTWREEYGKGF